MAGEAGNEGLTFHPMDQFKVKPLFEGALDYFALSNATLWMGITVLCIIVLFVLALYPYVYLLVRTSLAERGIHLMEAARLLGAGFWRRVRRGVGAYYAEVGGAQAVVFSGGIGENSAAIRRRSGPVDPVVIWPVPTFTTSRRTRPS